MAIVSTVAGSYSATYDQDAEGNNGPESIGETEDGFRVRYQFEKELITCDLYGDSAFDAVYRGGNVFLSLVGIQYSTLLSAEVIWPVDGVTGESGIVGRSDATTINVLTGIVVLTAASGTTAASAPATLTANFAALREGTGSELNFNNRLRKVPVEYRCYLYDTGSSAPGWFLIT